ncbi:MAG TPA: DPP IV N-terminal domain-containing protein, partial [Vicinamibacterales bacterium]
MRKLLFTLSLAAGSAAAVMPLLAQQAADQPRTLTAADYARAETFMSWNVTPLVYRSGVRANWLSDDRFWYRVTTPTGSDATLVDPASGSRSACTLPECAAGRGGRGGVAAGGGRGAAARNDVPSPDGKRTAYIKDWNLWVRDIATGSETQLTTDGVENYGYATDNAGWEKSDRAILMWSPDSKKIATFQQDQRNDGDMYVVHTAVGHPTLESWKYPLPGDKNVTTIARVVIDVDARKVIRFKMPPDQHRSTLCDNIACRGSAWSDVYWSPDATHVGFVSTSRDHRQENLRVADAATGDVRDVYEEKVPTFFESGNGAVNWRYLPDSNEFLWFSERDNWGQLYLYDLTTGKLKNPITTGDGNVTQVLHVDEKNRVIYFLAVGKDKGRDPYYSFLYRIGFDGRNMQLLTPEDATHDVTLSPDAKYFVDSYSTPQTPPVAVLRDAANGKEILLLEKADVSKLEATGWKPPQTVVVKARDGQTDLYGLMYTPTNLDQS